MHFMQFVPLKMYNLHLSVAIKLCVTKCHLLHDDGVLLLIHAIPSSLSHKKYYIDGFTTTPIKRKTISVNICLRF